MSDENKLEPVDYSIPRKSREERRRVQEMNCADLKPKQQSTDSDCELFEFSDFANVVTFEQLGAAVRRMVRVIKDWNNRSDAEIGSFVALAFGDKTIDAADEHRKKRLAAATQKKPQSSDESNGSQISFCQRSPSVLLLEVRGVAILQLTWLKTIKSEDVQLLERIEKLLQDNESELLKLNQSVSNLNQGQSTTMSSNITSHKVNGLNEALEVAAIDEPGQGNACHVYRIAVENGTEVSRPVFCTIEFQNGPIGEVGINGLSNEALLAVVEHRLLGFQSGQYACRENAIAITKLQEAMMWLHKRTRDRIARGVEGTHAK